MDFVFSLRLHLFLSSCCVCLLFNFPLFLPLSTSVSVSSLVAVPCWGESNLNYVSQGPIPLLPAVGISGLLISYQAVIGLRSPSPSDIPQIYDTPDSLRGGEEAGGFLLPANTLLNKMSSWPQRCQLLPTSLSSCKGIFNIMPGKHCSIFQINQPARGPAGFDAPC